MQTDEIVEKVPFTDETKPVRELCFALLKRRFRGELTEDAFNAEIAYIALTYGFDELRAKPYPTKPQEMLEYEALLPKQKKSVTQDFWRQPEIQNYLDAKDKIRHWNINTKLWLQEILRWLPETDEPSKQKVRERITDFEAFEQYNQ